MARSVCVIAFLLIVAGCTATVSTESDVTTTDTPNTDEVVLGDGVTGAELVPIGQLLDHPVEYLGKMVQVQGEVTEVCQQMGCWMEVRDEEKRAIRLKVEDGVIVFPTWAPGHQTRAEGQLERLEMDRDAYLAYREHEAEERGLEFDPASVGDGPYEVVRIRGTGAVVQKGTSEGP